MNNKYLQPMQPWPSLAPYARIVQLGKSRLRLYIFDAEGKARSDKAPLLLIHGLGDEADTWRHVVEPLAQDRRVIALDLPGFGRSDKPRRAYSLAFFNDIMIDLLDTLAIPKASLVGHSLGGIIAHTLALDYPHRFTDLTLIDGCLSPYPQKVTLSMVVRLLPFVAERYYNGLRGRPDAAYASLSAYYADMTKLQADDRAFLYDRVNQRVWSDGQRDAYYSVLRQMPAWMARHNRSHLNLIAASPLPTLVIWGREDRVVPIAVAEALVALFPAAHLLMVPGSGHMPHQEQPQQVVQAMKSHISSFHP